MGECTMNNNLNKQPHHETIKSILVNRISNMKPKTIALLLAGGIFIFAAILIIAVLTDTRLKIGSFILEPCEKQPVGIKELPVTLYVNFETNNVNIQDPSLDVIGYLIADDGTEKVIDVYHDVEYGSLVVITRIPDLDTSLKLVITTKEGRYGTDTFKPTRCHLTAYKS
jgi:hypothetical protein